MRFVKILIGLVVVAAVVVYGGRFLVGLADDKPLLMGLDAGSPRGGCPSTDNCVSSLATDPVWAVGHLTCPGDPSAVEDAFGRAITAMERVLQVDDRSWIVRSRWLHFPDDVMIKPSRRGLEIASASRLGGGDIGVNRRRVAMIAAAMQNDPACSELSSP